LARSPANFRFFLYRPLVAALEGAGVRPADAAFAMAFSRWGRVRPVDRGWLMDAMDGRYAFMLVSSAISWVLPAIRVSPEALWIAYSAAILYGTGSDGRLSALIPSRSLLWTGGFPKVSGMMLLLAALFCSPAGYLAGNY